MCLLANVVCIISPSLKELPNNHQSRRELVKNKNNQNYLIADIYWFLACTS